MINKTKMTERAGSEAVIPTAQCRSSLIAVPNRYPAQEQDRSLLVPVCTTKVQCTVAGTILVQIMPAMCQQSIE
jgi:hypothetical protein